MRDISFKCRFVSFWQAASQNPALRTAYGKPHKRAERRDCHDEKEYAALLCRKCCDISVSGSFVGCQSTVGAFLVFSFHLWLFLDCSGYLSRRSEQMGKALLAPDADTYCFISRLLLYLIFNWRNLPVILTGIFCFLCSFYAACRGDCLIGDPVQKRKNEETERLNSFF